MTLQQEQRGAGEAVAEQPSETVSNGPASADPATADAGAADVVEVAGALGDYFGLAQIVSTSVTVTASDMEPAPLVVGAAEIATDGPRSELLEAVLVRVESVTVTNPDLGFDQFEVNGTLRVDQDLFLIDPPPAAGEPGTLDRPCGVSKMAATPGLL